MSVKSHNPLSCREPQHQASEVCVCSLVEAKSQPLESMRATDYPWENAPRPNSSCKRMRTENFPNSLSREGAGPQSPTECWSHGRLGGQALLQREDEQFYLDRRDLQSACSDSAEFSAPPDSRGICAHLTWLKGKSDSLLPGRGHLSWKSARMFF